MAAAQENSELTEENEKKRKNSSDSSLRSVVKSINVIKKAGIKMGGNKKNKQQLGQITVCSIIFGQEASGC